MEHFNTYLKGRKFAIFTEHKPLETLSKWQDKTINRSTEAFLKYSFGIKYKKEVKCLQTFYAGMQSMQ
jgi:hypothetical protein